MKRMPRTKCLICSGPLLADDIYSDSVRCLHCNRWISRNGRHGSMRVDYLRKLREEWTP